MGAPYIYDISSLRVKLLIPGRIFYEIIVFKKSTTQGYGPVIFTAKQEFVTV